VDYNLQSLVFFLSSSNTAQAYLDRADKKQGNTGSNSSGNGSGTGNNNNRNSNEQEKNTIAELLGDDSKKPNDPAKKGCLGCGG